MEIKRRQFLKYLGITGASAVAAGWIFYTPDEHLFQSGTTGALTSASSPYRERWITSVCQLCPGGCGIRVRVIDNQPVKIEGNPLHPINRGGLCPTGLSGLHILYSPDRIRTPLQREGGRGSNQWRAISWDEAIELCCQKLRNLRTSGNAHKVVLLDGDSRGTLKNLFERFLTSYGTPNYIDMTGRRNAVLPFRLTQGNAEVPVFDLANTDFILSFGSDFLEAEGAPVWQYRMHARMRTRKEGRRGKLIVIDPRLSITAAKANRWVPIQPGTEAALALGIAHVLIQEELYNKTFVEQNTFGFEDWKSNDGVSHVGFRSLVLEKYYPESVSAITGVSIEDIFRFARSFADNQPGIAICGIGSRSYSNGFYTQLAVHSLNALVGNIGQTGGVLQAQHPPLSLLPDVSKDATTIAGMQKQRIDEAESIHFPFAIDRPSVLPDNIIQGHPYNVECLLIHNANPIFDTPSSAVWRQAFGKTPFIVGIGSFLNESLELADLILPEHTYLERWDNDWDSPNVNLPHVGICQPIVNPLYDTKHAGDILISIAKKFGSELSQAFPFDDYLSTMKYGIEGVFKSGRGSIITGTFEESMMEYMKERGWRSAGTVSFEEFWKLIVQHGGWFDTPGSPSPLQQVSGIQTNKFEFYSKRFEEIVLASASELAKEKSTRKEDEIKTALRNLNIQAQDDEVFLPHYEEAEFVGNELLYPLHLQPFRCNTLLNEDAVNTPAMLEMAGFRNYQKWDSWIEMNPTTAARYGIQDGERIWVESIRGKVKIKAKLFSGIKPDVIAIPLGMGHTVGRFSRNNGVNPLEIVSPKSNVIEGTFAISSTRVKVYKA